MLVAETVNTILIGTEVNVGMQPGSESWKSAYAYGEFAGHVDCGIRLLFYIY